MSLIFDAARDVWREMHDDYRTDLDRRIRAADEACHGYLVNRRGRAAGITPDSLFQGPADRAYRYATRELIDHWKDHPRVTLAQFEAEWIAARGDNVWDIVEVAAYPTGGDG